MDRTRKSQVDALAERVLDALVDFHDGLHAKRRRRFPVEEFDRLSRLVERYWEAMQGVNWIHRDLAREFNGFREYLELERFRAPSEFLAKADRMECMVFSDYDAYPEGVEPIGAEDVIRNDEDSFGLYEGQCTGCDMPSRVDSAGLCQECVDKLERDLIRDRDWAYSVAAYGLNDAQREDLRRQVLKTYGDDLELVGTSGHNELSRKQRRGRKPKQAPG